ncbi:hypothetical protein B0H19DRAFT_1256254 [Mycena capillaripes]|nr:hypothetical protein B0H19DRAFT_1259740 [Mycena capillaripes]KAJ6568490.1 hypothetical protein B0H19DRAFT_1256254 [Mycena capillaripes]
MSAHNYRLFVRPFVQHAQRALGTSEEGPDVTHSTPDVRKNIASIVNSMWDTGIAAGMELCPQSLRLPHRYVMATNRHAKNIAILFIWMKAAGMMPSSGPETARYAVGFFIPSDSPFQALLTCSCDSETFISATLILPDSVSFPSLITLASAEPAASGVLLYDKNLSQPLHLARQYPAPFKSSHFGHPIST